MAVFRLKFLFRLSTTLGRFKIYITELIIYFIIIPVLARVHVGRGRNFIVYRAIGISLDKNVEIIVKGRILFRRFCNTIFSLLCIHNKYYYIVPNRFYMLLLATDHWRRFYGQISSFSLYLDFLWSLWRSLINIYYLKGSSLISYIMIK